MRKQGKQIFRQKYCPNLVWHLAVWKDDFSATICLLRWTSRREYDIKLHQTNKCWTICIHVQTIDLSSSVRMANLLSHKENYSIASECKASISWSFSGKARCALVQVSVYYPRATPTQSVHLQATLICLVQHFTTNLKYPLQMSRWFVCIEAVHYIDRFYLAYKLIFNCY